MPRDAQGHQEPGEEGKALACSLQGEHGLPTPLFQSSGLQTTREDTAVAMRPLCPGCVVLGSDGSGA